jgi:hypothetical protein
LAVFAKVAELVDALDLGSSAYGVGVRVPPFAPEIPGRITAKTVNLSFFTQASMPLRVNNLLFLEVKVMMQPGMNIDQLRKTS